jgi:hypothetical protein
MSGEMQLLSARAVRWLDVGVVVWVIAWAVLGVLMWHDIAAQTQLGTDIIKVGSAVKDTGSALGVVGGLPLVGGTIGDFAGKIEKLGAEVMTSGQASQDGIRRAAVISGLAVGVLPGALALFLYLPVRLRWRRVVKSVADALPASAGDPAFEHYLARRAVDSLPWGDLRSVSSDPYRALTDGDYRALADAELARLGLTRP